MFDFDICAPHVTIPECFTDENSVMVVFDLGRLQFRNLSPKLTSNAATEQKQATDDDGQMIIVILSGVRLMHCMPLYLNILCLNWNIYEVGINCVF